MTKGGTVLLNAVWYGWDLVLTNALAMVTMLGAVALARRIVRAEIVAALVFALSVITTGVALSRTLAVAAVELARTPEHPAPTTVHLVAYVTPGLVPHDSHQAAGHRGDDVP